MPSQTTRRVFLGTALLAAVGGGTVLSQPRLRRPIRALVQDESAPVGELRSPSWVVVVHTVQDPYTGTVVRPEEQLAGMRYVGAEVEIRNESEVPLNMAASGVRLMGEDGAEYTPGQVVGSEPPLPTLNLEAGALTRGWVWYAVPEATSVMTLVHYGPPVRLAVSLPPEG